MDIREIRRVSVKQMRSGNKTCDCVFESNHQYENKDIHITCSRGTIVYNESNIQTQYSNSICVKHIEKRS